MIATVDNEPDSGYLRLEQQIQWYDQKSGTAQRYNKWVKVCEFVRSGANLRAACWHSLDGPDWSRSSGPRRFAAIEPLAAQLDYAPLHLRSITS